MYLALDQPLFSCGPKRRPKLTDAEVAKRARPGESWEAAHARLNQITLALAE